MLEITFVVIAVDMQRTIFPWIWQKVRFVFQEAGLHQLASDIYFFILLSCEGRVYQTVFCYQKDNHLFFQMQTGVLWSNLN